MEDVASDEDRRKLQLLKTLVDEESLRAKGELDAVPKNARNSYGAGAARGELDAWDLVEAFLDGALAEAPA